MAGQWLGTDISTMPVFSWLLALNVMAFGDKGAFAYVLTQGVLDAVTCLFVYGMAATWSAKFALPAGIAAAINPTQIMPAGLSIPTRRFCCSWRCCCIGALRWLRGATTGAALIIAIGLGGALLTRIVIVPFIPVLIVFLLAVVLLRRTFHAAPSRTRRVDCRHRRSLRGSDPVAQLDRAQRLRAHAARRDASRAYWVVPLVKEAKDGTPWERTAARR